MGLLQKFGREKGAAWEDDITLTVRHLALIAPFSAIFAIFCLGVGMWIVARIRR